MGLGTAVAVVAALAVVGIPSLILTVSAGESGSQTTVDGKPGNGPPAHARSRHNDDKDLGDKSEKRSEKAKGPKGKATKQADKMSSIGRRHGKAMRAWSACVAENNSDKAACGNKPVSPGHLKHDGTAR